MRYRDLFTPSKDGTKSRTQDKTHGAVPRLKNRCLIWSDNLEHAVAAITDPVHRQARYVWLAPDAEPPCIYVYRKHWRTGNWEFVEKKKGQIPLVNNNPFAPESENVFPANKC